MTTPNIENLASVTAILQTALTPAFLLVAIGTLLNIFVIRLSRIVDRSRELQAMHAKTCGQRTRAGGRRIADRRSADGRG